MDIDAALKELESLLPGLDYVVGFRLVRVPAIPGGTPEQYITAALGPAAVIGGVSEVSGPEVLAEVEKCIRYPGGHGSGPPKTVLRSLRFDELVGMVLANVEQAAAASDRMFRFWLSDGQPFYPVMWDFAFVFVAADGAAVFVGSSSD